MRRRRPVQDVRIFNIQDRTQHPRVRAYVVRWRIDGEEHTAPWRTRPEADHHRSRLLIAKRDGEWFDRRTGEPKSWLPSGEDLQVHDWARTWVAEQWPEWEPRTRDTDVYALARFLPLVVEAKAPDPPDGLRQHLRRTLRPDAVVGNDVCERWLGRWVLSLGDLDKTVLADVDRRLGIGDAGQVLATSTANRFRKVARSCIRRAVELERITTDPWPRSPRGRSQRKANRRSRRAVDIRRLPDMKTMVSIVTHMASHQPGSLNYQTMTEVTYYGGLRPSETAMLRPRVLHLPVDGWGRIEVVEADDGYDEPTEPKTGDRTVPIPPHLVGRLASWIDQRNLGRNDLLFRTRNGKRPTQSNWNRCLKRACTRAGHGPLDPYDARHACATEWIRSGVPLGTAALWLGHTVETLVSTYIGAVLGDDEAAMNRLNELHAAHHADEGARKGDDDTDPDAQGDQ